MVLWWFYGDQDPQRNPCWLVLCKKTKQKATGTFGGPAAFKYAYKMVLTFHLEEKTWGTFGNKYRSLVMTSIRFCKIEE